MNEEILVIPYETVMDTNANTRRAVYDADHVHSSAGKCLKWRHGRLEDCPDAIN